MTNNQFKPPPPLPSFVSFSLVACRSLAACLFFFNCLPVFFPLCPSPIQSNQSNQQYKTVAPLGDRIFVKIDEAEATSAGGILLPSAAQVKSTQGVVAATPKGGAKSLSEGDRVLYSKYAGTEIKMGKDEFVLLKVKKKGSREKRFEIAAEGSIC